MMSVPDNFDRTETHVDDDGLWIPPEFRADEGQLVIRTPRGTIQHWGGFSEPYYGLVRSEDFGPAEDLRDPKNPELAPDRVSIKLEGEEAVELDVQFSDDGGAT